MAERRSASSSTSSSIDSTLLSPKVYSVMNGKPDLKTVCAIVRTSRWHQLGIQLGVDSDMLHDIESEKSDTQDKRTQMFRLWIASQPEASHNQLVEALTLKVIGEDRMAQEYEERVKEEASKTTETTQTGITKCL
uniref:Death domain-containing protein n=1 Tax=Amphimedon queenslandica TaxID=400682 RepID=A0A1X7SSN1_AMPQE